MSDVGSTESPRSGGAGFAGAGAGMSDVGSTESPRSGGAGFAGAGAGMSDVGSTESPRSGGAGFAGAGAGMSDVGSTESPRSGGAGFAGAGAGMSDVGSTESPRSGGAGFAGAGAGMSDVGSTESPRSGGAGFAGAGARGCSRTSARVLDDLELYTRIYRQMLLIRGFEELVQSLFLKSEVYGTTHLYSGQEAVATGVASLLEERDRVAATYRGHGHALALGVDPQALLDEMLGRATGVNGGRAGSMNVTSPADRLIGSFGIVGGSIAAATGAALALSRTTGGVAVAYFGDGAMNQGYVFECLNFAQVQKLPLVLVCENNGYGEYTPFRSVTAGEIRARAEVMEVPAETVDGMSVWIVREAAARAIDHARSGDGPAFLEALTYRFVGHSRSDPGAYRPEGELDEWRTRDPIVVLRAQLEDEGAGASALDELEREVRDELERMRERGLAAPFPSGLTVGEFKD